MNLGKISICVKNSAQEVEYQNQNCIESCGDMKSQKCEKGCMDSWKNLSPNQKRPWTNLPLFDVHGKKFQGTIIQESINGESKLTTLAFPREDYDSEIQSLNLSNREKEILKHKLAGLTRKQMAELLFISDKTVKTHLSNIYRKLSPELRIKWNLEVDGK